MTRALALLITDVNLNLKKTSRFTEIKSFLHTSFIIVNEHLIISVVLAACTFRKIRFRDYVIKLKINTHTDKFSWYVQPIAGNMLQTRGTYDLCVFAPREVQYYYLWISLMHFLISSQQDWKFMCMEMKMQRSSCILTTNQKSVLFAKSDSTFLIIVAVYHYWFQRCVRIKAVFQSRIHYKIKQNCK